MGSITCCVGSCVHLAPGPISFYVHKRLTLHNKTLSQLAMQDVWMRPRLHELLASQSQTGPDPLHWDLAWDGEPKNISHLSC